MGWEPIETAPEGVLVDVWCRCGLHPSLRADLRLPEAYRIADVKLTESGWLASDGDFLFADNLTHWRHIPEAPTASITHTGIGL